MSEGLLVRFLLDRGATIPSPALLGQIGRRYQAAIERFAVRNEIPIVRFRRGESKEEVARPYFGADQPRHIRLQIDAIDRAHLERDTVAQ